MMKDDKLEENFSRLRTLLVGMVDNLPPEDQKKARIAMNAYVKSIELDPLVNSLAMLIVASESFSALYQSIKGKT